MTTDNIPPRWYMIARDGIAMLCASEQDALAEAAKADQAWPNDAPHVAVQLAPVQSAMPADAEFQITQDGFIVAGAEGPRDQAWAEIQRYAAQYAEDGPIEIWEITRRRIEGAGHANS